MLGRDWNLDSFEIAKEVKGNKPDFCREYAIWSLKCHYLIIELAVPFSNFVVAVEIYARTCLRNLSSVFR